LAKKILQTVVDKNKALRADADIRSEPAMLNRVLDAVGKFAAHDYLVAIISDFDGVDSETRRLVSRLAQHNDVIAVPVYDPLATDTPEAARLVVSDGELQVDIDTGRDSIRQRLSQFSDERLGAIFAWQRELGVPVLPITTETDALEQMRHLMGAR
jgi:uncharacterized protein (DUF58 family)